MHSYVLSQGSTKVYNYDVNFLQNISFSYAYSNSINNFGWVHFSPSLKIPCEIHFNGDLISDKQELHEESL